MQDGPSRPRLKGDVRNSNGQAHQPPSPPRLNSRPTLTTDMSHPSIPEIIDGLSAQLKLDTSGVPLEVTGQDPVSQSTHRIGDACAAALAVAATSISKLSKERGLDVGAIKISVEDAILQLTAAFVTKLQGVGMMHFFEDPTLFRDSDFYPAKGGRNIFLLLTYPPLRAAACQVLNCPPSRKDYADRISKLDAFELEEKINNGGGCAVAVRTRKEWAEHAQGQALAAQDLIIIEKLGDSKPENLSTLKPDELPLKGIRVLDNGHVIAAPMLARMMAEFGSTVLRISSPDHPDSPAMLNETGIGKKMAFCDMTSDVGRKGFTETIADADVYICNYRSLEKKGYAPEDLARMRPGIIFVDYSGWGRKGPWHEANWGGFDQLACSASGFSEEEGSFAAPKLPPTYLMNDYLAPILGLAAVSTLLSRRAKEGGSYVIRLNLCKIAMWVQGLGAFSHEQVQQLPKIDHDKLAAGRLTKVKGPNGTSEYLPTCLQFDKIRPHFKFGAEPAGASNLSFAEVEDALNA